MLRVLEMKNIKRSESAEISKNCASRFACSDVALNDLRRLENKRSL
jgi:hypothetical protein